ncbi:MAG TPA: Shedu anti-phage system protein SduA domain-containing protein [Telluria sp.]
MDAELSQQMSCLLGRIQYKWFREFHRNESLPGNAEIRHRLLEVHRQNPGYGDHLRRLIGCQITSVRQFNELQFGFDMTGLLDRLEKEPWSSARFLEIQGLPPPFEACQGIFIYQHTLAGSGKVYVITLYDEANFPNGGRMKVRASQAEPEPFLSVLTKSGYHHLSLEEVQTDFDDIHPQIKIGLLALHCLDQEKTTMSQTLAEARRADMPRRSLFPPPSDPICDGLIAGVENGAVQCTKLTIPSADIEPADFDHALLYPSGLIKPVMRELKAGNRYEILLYWKESSFKMSDDYAMYLAYRALGMPQIPAVVMGCYPEYVYGSGLKGGKELLPNIGYQFQPRAPDDKKTRLRILDARLHRELGPTRLDRFYDLIFQFHRLLDNPLTLEKALHKLILSGAKMFESNHIRVHTEVRFARRHRADLALQSDKENRGTVLIELKRANLPIFTKNGSQYAHVTRAFQQVEDWMRFWREHPSDVPAPLDPTIAPTGVVIMGRSTFLTEDEKRRLTSLNSNRRIQLFTYDDLLARVEQYVAMMS